MTFPTFQKGDIIKFGAYYGTYEKCKEDNSMMYCDDWIAMHPSRWNDRQGMIKSACRINNNFNNSPSGVHLFIAIKLTIFDTFASWWMNNRVQKLRHCMTELLLK